MQRGRRRLRQRAERDRESIGSSSGSDVELLAKSEELQQDTRRLKEEKEKEKAEAWACQMCTFVNEDASASKCELCESARPGPPRKTRKLSQWLSQPVERTEKKSKKKASSGAHTEPIEVIDSSDNGSDDDAASVASAASYSEAARAHRSNGKASGMAPTLASNKGLWADLYAPKTVDELCVNKKKVQEVSEWLERNASPSAGVFQKRLLFLCGPPGSGKSTAVRCIARKLGLLVKEWEDNSAAGKLNYERMLREDFWLPQKVIDSSNGDMRHALNMLQLSQNPTQKKAKVTASKKVKMSNFHVVGKLLHGKLLLNKSVDEHEMKSGADEIDYDQIFDASAMPLDRALGLVHENSIAYFSQVEDLSSALELMSLCEVMVAESYNGVSNSEAFKRSRDVAQAILMRTVAVTNENPAPKAFRPITRPRTRSPQRHKTPRVDKLC
ncbi:Cell cycle checkpoint protein RAD17 [Phytophthora cinnamomi]|uniref:Cell cycle checkpoint protein RAD17 n=1 Tax=Phytophthora cinnamomi TaxID=4785 RepID=UPI00355A7DA7|nr:Cell cycle checkpoint protein RAD17 [Phytophthora cinnamomi]